MFVGVARIVLSIPVARTLKDRRRVVHAFRDRVRARLSASISEVGDLERTQVATLGVAVTARSSVRCAELLSEVTGLAENLREAVVADVATEVISFGAGGTGIRGGIEKTLERPRRRAAGEPDASDREDEEDSE
ncbi:MAG TPA: DUF503 family protein [Polyangiaceae bacterium]|nr:DUF503 family protein [Polyangiaceae bacterium]